MVSDLKLSMFKCPPLSHQLFPSLNPGDTLVEMRARRVNVLSLSLSPSVFLFSLALPLFDFLSPAFS